MSRGSIQPSRGLENGGTRRNLYGESGGSSHFLKLTILLIAYNILQSDQFSTTVILFCQIKTQPIDLAQIHIKMVNIDKILGNQTLVRNLTK